MSITENEEVEGNFYNLEQYDPYVEIIRALFVPSLEPRIYSCLETFVYHKDTGESSDYSRLRQCLDVAASNLRVPVEAFCTNWNDEGLLENIITNAIKFLIKDGLIDCFLNSIILNNRLNKICRHLDGLGIEKDFLRYLAVWNYINEREYWIESDQNTPRSISEEFSDDHSDLDVEIGSRLCCYTNEQESRTSLKRCAGEMCSEDSQQSYDFSGTRDDDDETKRQVENWLGLDSIMSLKSKKSGKMRKKTMSRNFPCRASNCPTYRLKNSRQSDWEGKIIELKLSEGCCSTSKNNQEKSMKLSKLRLPCEFENFISKFTEADSVIIGLSSVAKKKKFRASLVNVCRRINEVFRKIDKKEVKRCKLYCEKFPNYLSFKITKRKSNGCEVCLLTDRLLINKIEDTSMNGSQDSSFSKLSQIMEDENSRDSDLTICQNPQNNLDSIDFMGMPKTQAKIDVDLNSSKTYLKSRKSTNLKRSIDEELLLNRSTESRVGDQTSNSKTADPLFDEKNVELDLPTDFQTEKFNTNDKELIQENFLEPRYKNSFEDDTCRCSAINDALPDCNNESNRSEDVNKKLSVKENLFHSTAFDLNNQTCPCNAWDSFDRENKNVSKDLSQKKPSVPSVDEKIQGSETPKALSPRPSAIRLQRRQTLQSKAFIDLPSMESWLQPSYSKLPSPEPFEDLAPKESSIQPSDDKIDNGVCPCSFPMEKSVRNSIKKDTSVVNEERSSEHPEKITRDDSATKQRFSNELSCLFDSKNVTDSINSRSFHMVVQNSVENSKESLDVDLNRCKSFTKIPVHNENEVSCTAVACECPSDCTCANKTKPDAHTDDNGPQYFREFQDDQGPSKLLNSAVKKPRNRDVSNQIPEMKCDGSMTSSLKMESNSIETQVDSKQFRIPAVQSDPKDQSLAPLSIPVKDPSRTFQKIEGDATKSFNPDRSSRMNESCEKSVCECAPLLSAKFSRPKAQRINISIELCPESDGSINKIVKKDKKSVRTLHVNSKNLENCRIKESRTLSSLGQVKCQSVDLDNRQIRVNQPLEKNTKDEWPGETNSRMHSPAQPLESRDYLPPVERVVSSMRNTSLYENPIKSGLRSNRKFERRSKSQGRKIFQDYQTMEFHEPIRNNRCYEKNIERPMRSRGNKNLTRSPQNSARFSSSFVNGHLCHAFSSSSIDRMRHLIKTKLRRILLERDKSTNTPKTSLANKKYRVSFPNGKTTERLPFQRKCCRTIWESHSASDSTPASRSFVSENPTEIHDGAKMCQLLYCSSKKSKKSSSNFESISRDSDFSKNDTISIDSRSDFKNIRSNESGEPDFMDERPVRLAGGSDFIPHKKIPEFGDFITIKNSRPRFSRMINKNSLLSTNPEKKLFAYSKNCDLPDNFQIDSDLLDSRDWDGEVLRKENEPEFIACSGKLDSSLKSTSRHIYFYEFFESPNDQQFDSNLRVKKKRQGTNKEVCLPEIRDEQKRKNIKIKENVYGKNNPHECQKRSTLNRDDHSRGRNVLNNSSPANTMSSAHKGFNYLDYDLRSKLSQYVSLCKTVKYSLLKRLRPNDAYGVSGTSISCGDHL